MKVHVKATGTRPLLMHNVQLASPLNVYARKIKEISSKRIKTEDDRLEMAQIEYYGGMYFDKELGPYIPGTMIFANLVEGARVIKSGKKVERGIDVVDLVNPLFYDGPRDMESLWKDPNFVDMRSVRVGTSRVDRTRPIFHGWQVHFDLLIDGEILDEDQVKAILTNSGTLTGLGDYRKMYGRYYANLEFS